MRIKFLQAKKQVQNRNELLDQLRHTLFQELILSKEHAAALSSSAGSSSGAAAASSASSSGTSSHSRGPSNLEENIKDVSEIISCLGA